MAATEGRGDARDLRRLRQRPVGDQEDAPAVEAVCLLAHRRCRRLAVDDPVHEREAMQAGRDHGAIMRKGPLV
jgi:hypothetical protein